MTREIYSQALPQSIRADLLCNKVFQLLVERSHELSAYIQTQRRDVMTIMFWPES